MHLPHSHPHHSSLVSRHLLDVFCTLHTGRKQKTLGQKAQACKEVGSWAAHVAHVRTCTNLTRHRGAWRRRKHNSFTAEVLVLFIMLFRIGTGKDLFLNKQVKMIFVFKQPLILCKLKYIYTLVPVYTGGNIFTWIIIWQWDHLSITIGEWGVSQTCWSLLVPWGNQFFRRKCPKYFLSTNSSRGHKIKLFFFHDSYKKI